MRSGGRGYAYCRGGLKRCVDLAASLTGLVLLSPILVLLSVITVLTSGRPVFFTQERIGLEGTPFRMLKFRSMMRDASRGLPITGRGDARVTAWGRILRATKLDELPQLLNVVRGEMSLVGPRPEVPRYVERYSADQRKVLMTRPGLTDPATIEFRQEEDLLAAVDEGDRERYYVDVILPRKVALNLYYLDRADLGYDLLLIVRTLLVVLAPDRR